jgi:hypothetical protein
LARTTARKKTRIVEKILRFMMVEFETNRNVGQFESGASTVEPVSGDEFSLSGKMQPR